MNAMKMRKILVLFLLAAVAWTSAADARVPLRRFAFVAGSNDGGESLVRLKYAESDARAFATVLQDIGGVRPQDLVLVSNPTLLRFQDALQRVRQMVASPRELDERRELVFYYSGHSDDDGLILGKDRLLWDDIRKLINDIPADVKVAILDSCSSGSLTRAKGGVARPAFLFDASADMTGHAFLTSASAEEAAQESDRIGSSYFTHFLISGLRGAADTAGDGLVTLNEAYTYAFQETLASTEKTQYGPQHPAYDINLSGSGDLVLTDLRSSGARLTVSEDIAGRLYLRDSDGNLAVELNKQYGQSVDLGLEPGTYSAVLDTKNARLACDIRVTGRQPATLTLASMHAVALDKAVARGDGADQPGYPVPSPTMQAANASDPAAAIGAAVGAAVGSALGKAVGTAVNAAITAAAAVAAAAPQAPPAPQAPEPAPRPQDSAAETFTRTEPFHLTLIPDFLMGPFASNVERIVSINLFIGSSGSVRGFEVGGFGNLESGDVAGFQAAGLFNVALGSLTGFQSAGLVNFVGGEARFFQAAGLVNVSSGVIGGQAGGLANLSFGDVIGAQAAGLFNWTTGDMKGAQAAGIFNWSAGDVKGAQVAGIFNFGAAGVRGAQVSGIANIVNELTGPQISLVNVADTVSAQVGMVNIARHVTGTQVGLFNFSQEIDGIPIGLISVEGRGRHDLELWVETVGGTLGMPTLGFSLGTKHLYTMFSAGWMPGSDVWTSGLGLGGSSSFGAFFLDYDLSLVQEHQGFAEISLLSFPGNFYPRVRLVAGLPLFGGIAINAGVSMRILSPWLSSGIVGYDASRLVFQPTFIVGVRI
jgi:hypothetical protein